MKVYYIRLLGIGELMMEDNIKEKDRFYLSHTSKDFDNFMMNINWNNTQTKACSIVNKGA